MPVIRTPVTLRAFRGPMLSLTPSEFRSRSPNQSMQSMRKTPKTATRVRKIQRGKSGPRMGASSSGSQSSSSFFGGRRKNLGRTLGGFMVGVW
jgi:hypothetical protein